MKKTLGLAGVSFYHLLALVSVLGFTACNSDQTTSATTGQTQLASGGSPNSGGSDPTTNPINYSYPLTAMPDAISMVTSQSVEIAATGGVPPYTYTLNPNATGGG